MDISNLSKQLKSHLNFEQLELKENENTQLIFDNSMTINIEVLAGSEQLFFYINYNSLHHIECAERNELLLKANYFTHETLGATFSICPDSNNIMLSRRIDLININGTEFIKSFDEFYQSCEYWKAQFDGNQSRYGQSDNHKVIEGAIYG